MLKEQDDYGKLAVTDNGITITPETIIVDEQSPARLDKGHGRVNIRCPEARRDQHIRRVARGHVCDDAHVRAPEFAEESGDSRLAEHRDARLRLAARRPRQRITDQTPAVQKAVRPLEETGMSEGDGASPAEGRADGHKRGRAAPDARLRERERVRRQNCKRTGNRTAACTSTPELCSAS